VLDQNGLDAWLCIQQVCVQIRQRDAWWSPTIEPDSILQAADLEKLTKDRLEHLGYWPIAVYQRKQQRKNAHSILKILNHT